MFLGPHLRHLSLVRQAPEAPIGTGAAPTIDNLDKGGFVIQLLLYPAFHTSSRMNFLDT